MLLCIPSLFVDVCFHNDLLSLSVNQYEKSSIKTLWWNYRIWESWGGNAYNFIFAIPVQVVHGKCKYVSERVLKSCCWRMLFLQKVCLGVILGMKPDESTVSVKEKKISAVTRPDWASQALWDSGLFMLSYDRMWPLAVWKQFDPGATEVVGQVKGQNLGATERRGKSGRIHFLSRMWPHHDLESVIRTWLSTLNFPCYSLCKSPSSRSDFTE